MTTGTFPRGLCKSEAERLAAACAFPVTLTEQRLIVDDCCGCFNETLDIGTAHPLAVSLPFLLLPTFLSIKTLGHDTEPLLSGLRYQTCCARRLNLEPSDGLHWTRIAQVSETVDYCFSFSR